MIPIKSLYTKLNEFLEKGFEVDSKLMHLAIGMNAKEMYSI
jgi:hypothetical protein